MPTKKNHLDNQSPLTTPYCPQKPKLRPLERRLGSSFWLVQNAATINTDVLFPIKFFGFF